MVLALLVCLVEVVSLRLPASPARSRDSRDMTVIAHIDSAYPNYAVPSGDADHSGTPEAYLYYRDTVRIVEYVSGSGFIKRNLGVTADNGVISWALGDVDRDGKSDLVVRYSSGSEPVSLRVYESRSPSELPDTLVWKLVPAPTIDRLASAITDLDADSAREVMVMIREDAVLYECVGDNAYERKAVLDGGFPARTCDMDLDGKPELPATDTFWETVAFIEAVGNDSFATVGRAATPGIDGKITAATGAPDLDGDGRPELVVVRRNAGGVITLAVFEATADDSFQCAWTRTFNGGSLYLQVLALGDVDGDSTPEIAVSDGLHARLFRCTGPDQYEQFWHLDYYPYSALGLCDMNLDGRAELILDAGGYGTDIREWLPVGVEERAAEALCRVEVQPSVVRSGEAVQITGRPSLSQVEVVDASGRIVATPASGVWRPASSVPGTYFIRIRLGN